MSLRQTDVIHCPLAVIGGGPAGLRAAEAAAASGVAVTLFDAKPSVGRKFLVAGKGGLNLTHGEDLSQLVTRYVGPNQPAGTWDRLLDGFGPQAMRAWADGLGVETFQASSGRIYPKALKAAPLLRRWIARLKTIGVRFEMNHRWLTMQPGRPHQIGFANGKRCTADAVVFALGGASWPQTGSDGTWHDSLARLGIACNRWQPANCGWRHSWPNAVLAAAEGHPLKNITASAGNQTATGELLITHYGLEGGIIYQLGRQLRAMDHPQIAIDLKPTFSHHQLLKKMESVRSGFLDAARVRWRLSEAAVAILTHTDWHDAASLAHQVKHCVIQLDGPQPVTEAISSAGGVCWHELDDQLMLKQLPGVFVAGEMVDWEAPTGGYLLQGCFASGDCAGRAAAALVRALQ